MSSTTRYCVVLVSYIYIYMHTDVPNYQHCSKRNLLKRNLKKGPFFFIKYRYILIR